MKNIVIYDTNIFIDLYNIQLLDVLVSYGVSIHTTSLVLNELKLNQQEEIKRKLPNIQIYKYDTINDYMELYDYCNSISNRGNLSTTDCSVLKYARDINGMLCTNDKKLRSVATIEGIGVKGIIGIIEELYTLKIIDKTLAIDSLHKLQQTNKRLEKIIQETLDKMLEI